MKVEKTWSGLHLAVAAAAAAADDDDDDDDYNDKVVFQPAHCLVAAGNKNDGSNHFPVTEIRDYFHVG
jgi:hypothetical protein